MPKDFAPAAERNKQVISNLLASVLPERGLVLEVASGSGQHVAEFAASFPHLDWQPTDLEAAQVESIRAYATEAALSNVRDPIVLDATAAEWPVDRADAMVNINMIHISPWETCLGLLAGAGRVLRSGAALYLYGPYRIDGELTPDSNARFDAWLRELDPSFGVRELRDVETEARAHGLHLERFVAMPANNYSVILRKA